MNNKQIVIGNVTHINDEDNLPSSFIILKNGDIIKNKKEDVKFINIKTQSEPIVSISLENEGCIFKYKTQYINYIGTIYKGKVISKKWRNREYWEPYTTKQINSLIKLTKKLCDEYEIPKFVVSNNIYLTNMNEFEGIAFRSNYSKYYYDVSPAFNIELFKEKIEIK